MSETLKGTQPTLRDRSPDGTAVTRHDIVTMYRTMLRIRRFEERAADLFRNGEIPGFVHLCIGQESVAGGLMHDLRRDDYITTTHRGHGHMIAKGAELGPMFAELMGRETGYCRGRGGSMHICDLSAGVLGANGILGAGLPIAVGAAFNAQRMGRASVALAFFGEGASAQGYVHEAMNLAALWKLPVVFVAEINGYAELTPYKVHVSVPSLAERATAGYGIPAWRLDGENPVGVLQGGRAAIAHARGGGGPVLVEVSTARLRGHYEGDPQRYRPQGELSDLTAKDTLAGLREHLIEALGVPTYELEQFEEDLQREIGDAVEAARQAPLPSAQHVADHVYAEEGPCLV